MAARVDARVAGAALGAGMLGVLGAASCKTPTEVTVALASEVGYRGDMAVSVQIDREGSVEAAPPRVVTKSAWSAAGEVGSVVVVPSGDDDDVMMRVVLAAGRDPASCSATDASGCVVVRRRVRFTRGESTQARIVLRPACLGVFCDARSSCASDGLCGSLDGDTSVGDAGTTTPAADAGDPYANVVVADRPRHYYRLDEPEGSTVAKDLMGRANGTYERVKLGVTGGLRTTTNTGAFFDGTARVIIPKAEDLRGAFTVEAWARSDGSDAPRPTIVERVDTVGAAFFGYRMSKPPGAQAAFEIFRGATAFSAGSPSDRFGGYAHYVAVVKGTSIELWADGTRRDLVPTVDAPVSAVLGPLVIGASGSGASAFRGAIDEVAIYDYPLDESQIRRHHEVAEPSR
ncbi:MAG: LamG domain-containing protein [Deltaproteobacteria bacterium]|nr:LamG domain-containing protein [Deltaproteobacteria bacterium]